jgi:hypothetical protein
MSNRQSIPAALIGTVELEGAGELLIAIAGADFQSVEITVRSRRLQNHRVRLTPAQATKLASFLQDASAIASLGAEARQAKLNRYERSRFRR